MSPSPITPDDPRLTAYVLGELSPDERAAVEAALVDSPALRREVEELRQTSSELFAALQGEVQPQTEQRSLAGSLASLAMRAASTPQSASASTAPSRRGHGTLMLVNAITLLLLWGAVTALRPRADQDDRQSEEQSLARLALLDAESKLAAVPTAPMLLLRESEWRQLSDLQLGQRPAEREGRNALDEEVWGDSISLGQFAGGARLKPKGSGPVETSGQRQRVEALSTGAAVPGEGLNFGSNHSGLLPAITSAGVAVKQRLPLTQPGMVPARHAPSPPGGGLGGIGPEAAAPAADQDAYIREFGGIGAGSGSQSPTTGPQVTTGPQSGPVAGNQIATPRVSGAGAPASDPSVAGAGHAPISGRYLLKSHVGSTNGAIWDRLAEGWNHALVGRRPSAPADGATDRTEPAAPGSYFTKLRRDDPSTAGDLEDQPKTSGGDYFYAGHRFQLLDDFGLFEKTEQAVETSPAQESYAPIVEHDFIVPAGEAALSTFALDVDTASYANVRRFLSQQQLPPPDAVRIEELVNYFAYDLPRPPGKEPFAVALEATSCPWNPQHRLVRIGLQARELDLSQRPLTRLVFLLDVSGSMSDSSKLPLVKESLRLLVPQLGENDRIAIVTYSNTAELKLPSTPGSEREAILAAIDSLQANGSTNGAAGIQLAYEVAAQQFHPQAANRVILCTDGDFNVGVSSDDELVRMIEQKRTTGVFLSIFGYGMGNLKDSKLEGLADKGNGHYGYIDDLEEARKVFVEELAGTLYTVARDVKLQVEFNPARVAAYRLLGYENRLLTAEDFNNDTVDAGEVGAGHAVTALYEIVPLAVPPLSTGGAATVDPLKYQRTIDRPGTTASASGPDEAPSRPAMEGTPSKSNRSAATRGPGPEWGGELLTVKLRYKEPLGEASRKQEFPLVDEPQSCSRDLQFAAAVTGFGLLLRRSPYAAGCNWDLVIELAEGGKGEDPTGRRGEFVALARQARRLWQTVSPHSAPPAGHLTSAGSTSTGSTRERLGKVTDVTGGKLAAVSCGARHGLRDGQVCEVLRLVRAPREGGQDHLVRVGQLRILVVEQDASLGRFEPWEGAELLVGDDVVAAP